MLTRGFSKLRLSSQIAVNEDLAAWDRDTDRFVPFSKGRVYRFDRFKAVLDKPTKREVLSLPPGTKLPPSLVIQRPSGDVFCVSDMRRSDDNFNTVYDLSYFIHRAEKGTLTRPKVSGTGIDLGPVILFAVGKLWADVSFYSSRSQRGDVLDLSSSLNMTVSKEIPLYDHDRFTLGKDTYEVLEVFEESGFQVARVEKSPYDYKDFIFKYRSGSGSYNPVTGQYNKPTEQDLVFSAIASDYSIEENPPTVKYDMLLHVLKFTVGFEFTVGSEVWDGTTKYVVNNVMKGKTKKQIRIGLRRG